MPAEIWRPTVVVTQLDRGQKWSLSEEDQKRLRSLPMREQYAYFCALGQPSQFDERFDRGWIEFPQLIAVDGIEAIGISWDVCQLHLGTSCIDATDSEGLVHEIGEMIITIVMHPSGHFIENVTRTLTNGEGSFYAHPHAMHRAHICLSNGENRLDVRLADGRYTDAVATIVTGLFMRPGTVNIKTPYGTAMIKNWPIKQGVK